MVGLCSTLLGVNTWVVFLCGEGYPNRCSNCNDTPGTGFGSASKRVGQRDRSTAAIELSKSPLEIGVNNCEIHHRKAISAPTELLLKEVAKMLRAWFQIGVSDI